MILRVFLFSVVLSFTCVSNANICSFFFQTKPTPISNYEINLKKKILQDALLNTKIKLTTDQKYISGILNEWSLQKTTPAKVERVAQALVMKVDQKRTFMDWLRELVLKADPLKEAVRVRGESLVLARELLHGLEVRGYSKGNTKYENYLRFKNKHYNKIQLAKLVAINTIAINFLGFPVYFPKLDWIRNLDLKDEDLDLIQQRGFTNVYEQIKSRHKNHLRVHLAAERAPHVFFLSVVSYVGYNYLTFKVEKEIETQRYDVPVDQTIPAYQKLFLTWKVDYEKRYEKTFDTKNPEDMREWNIFIKSTYHAWADVYQLQYGRYPDLSKKEDRQEWEKFLSDLE